MVASILISLFVFLRTSFLHLFSLPQLLLSFNQLLVIDLRVFRWYRLSIKNNAIQATDFMRMSPLGLTASPQEHMAKGLVVFDPGFRNTAVRESKITFIDGNRGALQYRNYSIGYLFKHHDYEDVVYLLVWGQLPSPDAKLKFRGKIANQMKPDQTVIKAIQSFNPGSPSFLMIMAGLSAWAASKANSIPSHAGDMIYLNKPEAVDAGIYRALAAFHTVVALVSCHQEGKTFTPSSDPTLSSIENMLIMMGRVDEAGKPDKKASHALNKLWILFADHEMTNSTAAFLHTSSSLSDPLSCCIASVATGNGPIHGGAIDLAYKRFKQMGNKEGVQKHMEDVRAKKCRLMGVGHRVYRTVDPRAQFLKSIMADLTPAVSKNPLLEVAMEIDRIVATDSYFVSRGLSINADLYGSFVYAALGFDSRVFTQLASTARCAGALAHWKESMSLPPNLWRPRQVFNGDIVV